MNLSVELRELVAEVLGVDAKEIADDWGPGTSETWDSLNHLRIISAIEQDLGVSLTMDEIQSADSFAKLAAIVARKGNTA